MIDSPDAMSRVGAFFDVDRTIVSCNTGRLFLRDLRRRGEISFFRMLRALGWMAKYHLSLIDLQWVATRLAGEMAGKLERDFAERCRKWVETEVLPLVVPGAREKIEKHRAEGHVLAILSTSPVLRHRAAGRGAGHRGGDLDPVRGSKTGCSPAACSARRASAGARCTGPRTW